MTEPSKNVTCYHCLEAIDLRVAAVRDDEKVGRGTATYTDETFTDMELVAYLNASGIKPAQVLKAVTHMRWHERLVQAHAAEIRSM